MTLSGFEHCQLRRIYDAKLSCSRETSTLKITVMKDFVVQVYSALIDEVFFLTGAARCGLLEVPRSMMLKYPNQFNGQDL